MTDARGETGDDSDRDLLAHRCPNGHVTYPGHTVCPECGEKQEETVDLSDRTAEVLTWTESVATPSGVRAPNTLAIVKFTFEGSAVRALGQTTGDVEVGDTVEPVPVEELRDPTESLRSKASQSWSGYRFAPR